MAVDYLFSLLLIKLLSSQFNHIKLEIIVSIEDLVFTFLNEKKNALKLSSKNFSIGENSKRIIHYKNNKELLNSYSTLLGILSEQRYCITLMALIDMNRFSEITTKFIRQITSTSVKSKHSCTTIEGLKKVTIPIAANQQSSDYSRFVLLSSKIVKQLSSLFQV
jgi:hypothetical protein